MSIYPVLGAWSFVWRHRLHLPATGASSAHFLLVYSFLSLSLLVWRAECFYFLRNDLNEKKIEIFVHLKDGGAIFWLVGAFSVLSTDSPSKCRYIRIWLAFSYHHISSLIF